MILSRLSKREKFIFYFCLSLSFIFLIYNFIIEPIHKKINGLNKKIEAKKIKLEKSFLVLNQKNRVEEEYNKYYQNLQFKETEEEAVANFLTEIENLAGKNGVRISDMKPHPPKGIDFYKKFTVSLEAEGEVTQLTQFIYQVETTIQLLRVDKIRLETKSSQRKELKSYMLISKILIP